ncbi:MAG: stage sporulation protein [Planctomycetota bacterium]|jgi:cell division protein FtsW
MSTAWLRLQLWILTGALCSFGLVMVASTTGGDGIGMVVKQAVCMGVGAGFAIALSLAGLHRLRSGWAAFAAAALAVLGLLAALTIGREINGARRWIDLGGFNVQPAEIAKVAVVLAGAWWFARCAERVRAAWEGVLIPLAGFAVLGGLVFITKDLGSVVVMAVALAGLLTFAGANAWFYAGIAVSCLPAAAYVAIFRESYRMERILAFMDPTGTEGPAGFHLRQSIIAIGSGGIFGAGLGESVAKLGFLPEDHTDFIFAVICNELGLVGGLGLALVYLWLAGVGILIAARSQDLQARLIAVGATLIIATQAFWHMLVAPGGVPTKGLTLPFISYGGSSVVICVALIGILDAVARAIPAADGSGHTTRVRGAVVRSRTRWEQVRSGDSRRDDA